MKTSNILEVNYNRSISYQNLWDIAEIVLREKFKCRYYQNKGYNLMNEHLL